MTVINILSVFESQISDEPIQCMVFFLKKKKLNEEQTFTASMLREPVAGRVSVLRLLGC